jgi:hypothetical protein
MKNLFKWKLTKIVCFVCVLFSIFSYTRDDVDYGNSKGGAEGGKSITAKKAIITLPSIISTNTTLTNNNTYLLNGKVVVKGGATLTIDPGTRILGLYKSNPAQSSALIITRGSKIQAVGTPTQPIIFTGRVDATNPTLTPGDWGGIVILGNGITNRTLSTLIEGINELTLPTGVTNDDVSYGLGTVANDDSGRMSYVRVEYAGAIVTTDNELNSFTFGGVGSGTTLDHLQAFRGADDGFEFFGGSVNAKYLISTSANDDAFDFDFGYNGKLQFLVAILNPNDPFSANANAIESDNDGTGTGATPITRAVMSNVTIVGTNTGVTSSGVGLVQFGAHVRRNSNIVLRNSIIYGYREGIRQATAQTGLIIQDNVWGLPPAQTVNGIALPAGVASNIQPFPLPNFIGIVDFLNTPNVNDIKLVSPFQFSGFFSSVLKALRPTAAPSSTGAIFDADLLDPFFTPTTYKGAISNNPNPASNYWIGDVWVNRFNLYTP